MMKKGNPTEDPTTLAKLTVTREDAKSQLEVRILKGYEIKSINIRSKQQLEETKNAYYKWDAFNTELLKRLFTKEDLADEYISFGFAILSGRELSLGEEIEEFHDDLDQRIHRIDSIIERLELFPEARKVLKADTHLSQQTNRVFIVHGHDEVAKNNLEIFLREIGFEPVVLHRQADVGLTVIEKFEKHSDVGYAFILLTPDEIAYLKSEEQLPDAERKKEKRARPNVIFEFGYFVGKLGRSRVCCLYSGDVKLPSDVSGMIYKQYNDNLDSVKYSIIKDLKESGYRPI